MGMTFSFVVLTWNRYRFLEICLEALLASLSSPADCELLVMDNGSTDATEQILQRYEARPNVRVFRQKSNLGIKAYKKLFSKARGTYIVVVDDDALSFPPRVDETFATYMQAFPDYGFLSLNVIQNEFTNGAKPEPENYVDDTRHDLTVERGPAGGWCACFRRGDYRKLRWRLMFTSISMKYGEDSFLTGNFKRRLSLHSGVIRDAVCLHATGPHYAQEFGHLDREIEKYAKAGMPSMLAHYKPRNESESGPSE